MGGRRRMRWRGEHAPVVVDATVAPALGVTVAEGILFAPGENFTKPSATTLTTATLM